MSQKIKEIIQSELFEAGITKGFQQAVEKFRDEQLKLDKLRDEQDELVSKFKKSNPKDKERLKKDLISMHKKVQSQQKTVNSAEQKFNKALQDEPEELEESKLRKVKVTYDTGDTITTSMAANLSDKKIKDYFKKGKEFNIGSGGKDKMAKVKDVEILEDVNESTVAYIKYLNKDKGHKEDIKKFKGKNFYDAGQKAKKWAEKNLDSFDQDMIHYESVEDVNESTQLSENFSKSEVNKIKDTVEKADSLVKLRKPLNSLGIGKVEFSFSPIPHFMIKKGSSKYIILSDKYADDADWSVNGISGGILEGVTTEGCDECDGSIVESKVELRVGNHPKKRGYTIFHDKPGFMGSKGDYIGWYKKKSDAESRKSELEKSVKESINENASKLRRDIEKEKTKLKRKWKSKGGYENFGQSEVRKLRDKYNYNDLRYGSPDERSMAQQIDRFDDWAMNYTGQNESINESYAKSGGYVVKHSKDGYVKSIPNDKNKRAKEVTVDGEVYRWNPVYKTYNSVKGNELLHKNDLSNAKSVKREAVTESRDPKTIEKLRKIVDDKSMGKVDGTRVDLTTANAVVKVYDNLSGGNQKKFGELPLDKMINVTWKLVK